ncbi:ATP-binding protein [Paraburkholderia sediminicola]|uniref:NACHT domain-containing protein n=1 Tax=Paraburkholderia sediminicola TaxID=458836 RepID=UPI0038BA7192
MDIALPESGRYWAPRGRPIQTDEHGYTLFAGGKWREYHNTPVKQTHELREASDVIVLLGEPGSGKSFELNLLRTLAQSIASRKVLSLDLGKYADAVLLDTALRRLLNDCISEGVPSVLFLDALDESRVNIKCAETVLEDVLRDVNPDSLQLVVTCRTPAWPDSLEEVLRAHWDGSKESAVCVFEIAPYSRQQVSARLLEEGIDDDGFFAALDGSGAHGLALQPLGLRFLMSQFNDGSKFSSSRWELYERGCTALLKESSKRRLEGRSLLLPNVQSRLQLAGLIATCVLLTNSADIVLDNAGNFAPEGALYLDVARLVRFPLTSCGGDWYASAELYAETLQTGLFGAKEDGVFVFAHRTYAEFLAAHFISSLNAPVKRIMSVLSLADGSGRLVPQLRELSAWLGNTNPQVLALVLGAEPAMVFDSSVSLTDEGHIAAVFDELTALVERHKFPIYDRRLIRSYQKLSHATLCEKLRCILPDRARSSTLRQFAADVAHVCGLVDDIPALLDIALDPYENYEVRQSAASAVHADGSSASKLALLPLMEGDHPEDPDDELRGIALLCALEAEVPVRDLVGYITKERRSNFTGMYALALRRLENIDLQAPDVVPLLSWLEPQLRRERLSAAWENFVTHLFSKAAFAVMSFNEGWAALGKAAWLAISNHHKLSSSQDTRGFDRGLELDAHPLRRLQLLESILDAIEGDPRIVAGQLLYGTGLLTDADGQYLIDAYKREAGSNGVKKQTIANLALWYLFDNDVVREWLLNVAGPNAENRDALLAGIAAEHVDFVLLDSPRADSLRELLALRLKHSSPTEPIADKKRSVDLLSAALTRAEEGHTWEWVNILSYLRYEGDFEYYHFPFPAVTTSPLWLTLNAGTQSRLAHTALAYLRDMGPVATLAPNQSNNYEDAGIAALVFLHSTGHGNSDEFGELVVKWARGLARYLPEEQPREVINELLRQAWARAEAPVLSLLSEICAQYLSVDGIPRLPDFAIDFIPEPLFHMLEATLPRVTSEQGFLVLSSFLIERHSQDAIGSLLQRITLSPDLSAASAIKLLALLAKHAPEEFIKHVWERLQGHPNTVALLAAEMQIIVAGQDVPLLRVDAAVTEQLFEILESQYPTSTDIKADGILTARHHIQDFRTSCIINLRSRADGAGISALERVSARHPQLPWIASVLHEAEQKVARDSWLPYEVSEVVAALGIAAGRVIRTEAELHDAVLGELQLIADKVSASASLPAVYHLWDETSRRPKHEPRLCDWLAAELTDRLSHKGAVVNREVQVRSHNPKGMGERTDILVELSPPAKNGKSGNTLRLVIEVKGCWNAELMTAPASQLRDNYMKAYSAASGIYLIMWFMCDRWTQDDQRKRETRKLIPNETFDACVDAVTEACIAASVGAASLTPFVIDCTY